jgi:hypothetical protein
MATGKKATGSEVVGVAISHDRKAATTETAARYGKSSHTTESDEKTPIGERAIATDEMGEKIAVSGRMDGVGADGDDGGGAKSPVGAAAMERPICRQSSLPGVPS